VVADAPTEGGEQRDGQAEGRRVGVGVHQDDDDPRDRERQRQPLNGLQPLARQDDGQADGEEHLRLQHQRGQPGRDPAVHGDEQEAELAGPDQQAIGRQVPPRRGPLQEQGQGEEDEGEAQRREEQRRQVVQADADDHEVDPPNRHHR
jgi:hypothetical protein